MNRQTTHIPALPSAFLDIDNFRDYNTLYGHQEGDRVIRFVASILKENIDGIVGRNGGDEFLFCLAAVDSKTTIENEIRTVLKTTGRSYKLRNR